MGFTMTYITLLCKARSRPLLNPQGRWTVLRRYRRTYRNFTVWLQDYGIVSNEIDIAKSLYVNDAEHFLSCLRDCGFRRLPITDSDAKRPLISL